MKFVLYTNHFSPHELPLVRACTEVFDEVWYIVDEDKVNDPSRGGWVPDLTGLNTLVLEWLVERERGSRIANLLDRNTVVMYGLRDNPYENVFQQSPAVVIYASERWLKPYKMLPGICHLLQPTFVRSVWRYKKYLQENPRFFYFGLGVHAVRDMVLLTGKGFVSWFEKVPVGVVRVGHRELSKMRVFGYFVAPRVYNPNFVISSTSESVLRVLWVGRMLDWKQVDTLIRAVVLTASRGVRISCTLVGNGPEKNRLEKLALKLTKRLHESVFTFRNFVPMDEVRRAMCEHDIYVLPSNSGEGWGAVVNEALEMGMIVLCSREAGSGATMLPEECLFDAGDIKGLARKIETVRLRPRIGVWTPQEAANRLRIFAREFCHCTNEQILNR